MSQSDGHAGASSRGARGGALLGLAVSAFFLWWIFRGEDLGAIARQLTQANPWLLAAAVGVATSGYLIRALRWRILLEPLGVPTRLRSRWTAIIIGFMVINLLPARIGEVARPFALGRMEPVPPSSALGTVVLERVLDAVALLLLLTATLLSPTFPSGATVVGRPIGAVVSVVIFGVAAAFVLIGLLLLRPASVLGFAQRITHRAPALVASRVIAALTGFIRGLELLRRPSALFAALLWSLLLWLWMAASLWVAFRAFGLDLGFTEAMFTQCAVAIFVALPATPGFVGTFHAGVAVSLIEVFGVAPEPTLSLAVGYHIGGFIPVTALGLWYLSRMGLNLREVAEGAEDVATGQSEVSRP